MEELHLQQQQQQQFLEKHKDISNVLATESVIPTEHVNDRPLTVSVLTSSVAVQLQQKEQQQQHQDEVLRHNLFQFINPTTQDSTFNSATTATITAFDVSQENSNISSATEQGRQATVSSTGSNRNESTHIIGIGDDTKRIDTSVTINATAGNSVDQNVLQINPIIMARYKQLKRICRRTYNRPSFMRLLQCNLDNSDEYNDDDDINDDEYDESNEDDNHAKKNITLEQLPKRIRIDLDAELGLKQRSATNNSNTDNIYDSNERTILHNFYIIENDPNDASDDRIPPPSPTSAVVAKSLETQEYDGISVLPSEEGWYEGIAPLYMPYEDHVYVTNPIQLFLRQNIHFFSAVITTTAPSTSLSSNTTPTLPTTTSTTTSTERGRVGLRCNHCTIGTKSIGYEILQKLSSPYCMGLYDSNKLKEYIQQQKRSNIKYSRNTTPSMSSISGAIYYPHNVTHFATGSYSNKFQNHFLNHCPYISDQLKISLYNLLEDTNNNTAINTITNSSNNMMSHQIYNIITARRIGLVDAVVHDVDGKMGENTQQQQQQRGIRFRRDLNCSQPLLFTNIRYKVEHEYNITVTNSYGNVADGHASLPVAVPRANRGNSNNNSNNELSLAEAQAVLAETIAETDTGRLCLKADKVLLTDFIFLAMRQMSLCHTQVDDLNSKWKRSRNLIIGFAGYCCRWCEDNNKGNNETNQKQNDQMNTTSSRFFPSASDHLTSGIASSFVSHLHKCKFVPNRIKDALVTFKKLHLRQMQEIPHGSQRKMYLSFWSKLRAEDKNVDGTSSSNRTSKDTNEEGDNDVVIVDSDNKPSTSHIDDELEDDNNNNDEDELVQNEDDMMDA